MRVWDLDPKKLCLKHLMKEHADIHVVWNILTEKNKKKFVHVEIKRWIGKEKALFNRHALIVDELLSRGLTHMTELIGLPENSIEIQDEIINTKTEQKNTIKMTDCKCKFY
jgi:hypothetical protein